MKFNMTDTQEAKLIDFLGVKAGGEDDGRLEKYFQAYEKIEEFELDAVKLNVTKMWDDESEVVAAGEPLDLSQAHISLEVTPAKYDESTQTYVEDYDSDYYDYYGEYPGPMHLDMYGMKTVEAGGESDNSFYRESNFYDRSVNNGWTTEFLLPVGAYRIREVNRETHVTVDGAPFHTGSTTYTYNGTTTSSTVGEGDDPGVIVDVSPGSDTVVALKNVRDTGHLVVAATGDGGASDVFSVTVTLDDEFINGVFGDFTFTNGVAEFTLKSGESATAEGLPAGVRYTVAAQEVVGFTVSTTDNTGVIEKDATATVLFDFTRDTESLLTSTSSSVDTNHKE